MPTQKLFTPRDAAQVLGISYPTLKQWIYKGKIRTAKTAGGHHRVPEREIDKFLYRATEPVLRPVRQVIKPMGGLDWSFLVVIIIGNILVFQVLWR